MENVPLTNALAFLRDDNGYRAAFVTKEIADYTYTRESVDASVIVAAFIAGVQSQIISLTYTQNNTHLQVATNVYGFLGLVLDILGASIGVIHAIKLKRLISEEKEGRHYLDNAQLDVAEEMITRAVAVDENLAETLRNEIEERRKYWKRRRQTPYAPSGLKFQEHLLLLFPRGEAHRTLYSSLLRTNLGDSPIKVVRLGIAFLLISVLCFAGHSQPRAVWITSVVVTLVFGSAFIQEIAVSEVMDGEEGPVLLDLDRLLGANVDALNNAEGGRFPHRIMLLLSIVIRVLAELVG